MRVTNHIFELKDNEVFVFGSNLKGKHETGAAKQAMKFGANYGQGEGLQGKTYALPTVKDKIEGKRILMEIDEMRTYINNFIQFATINIDKFFLITEVGCGLAGHSVNDIAPLFQDAKKLNNISMPKSFWDVLNCL